MLPSPCYYLAKYNHKILHLLAGGLDAEGATDASGGAMGQRVLHDIKVETYTPLGEGTYAPLYNICAHFNRYTLWHVLY